MLSRLRGRCLTRSTSLLLVVSLGLLAAGCDGQLDRLANRTMMKAGDKYVALGDSYTSAPGVGKTDTDEEKVCGRSENNYPNLIAEELDLFLVDVSCGSATTGDVGGSQTVFGRSLPPQIDAVTEEADLVSISLGANDSSIIPILNRCLIVSKRDNKSKTPCADLYGNDVQRAERISQVRQDLIGKLVNVVDAVAAAAPDARILLIGYPHFLPADSGCDQLPVADGDAVFLHGLNLMLNEGVKIAAEETDIEYVDIYGPTEGHDICAEDPWIAGEEPTKPAAGLHPYGEEQEAVAEAVVKVVSEP